MPVNRAIQGATFSQLTEKQAFRVTVINKTLDLSTKPRVSGVQHLEGIGFPINLLKRTINKPVKPSKPNHHEQSRTD
jgi:hypothetical protein